MANQLKMAVVQTILHLKEHGWSNRRIERELGIRRETVSRYLRLSQQDPKPAKAPPGSPSKCEPFRQVILDMLQKGLSAHPPPGGGGAFHEPCGIFGIDPSG